MNIMNRMLVLLGWWVVGEHCDGRASKSAHFPPLYLRVERDAPKSTSAVRGMGAGSNRGGRSTSGRKDWYGHAGDRPAKRSVSVTRCRAIQTGPPANFTKACTAPSRSGLQLVRLRVDSRGDGGERVTRARFQAQIVRDRFSGPVGRIFPCDAALPRLCRFGDWSTRRGFPLERLVRRPAGASPAEESSPDPPR